MKFFAVELYMAILFVIAFFSMKKTKTPNDFFLGNRSIGSWVSALTYGTTYFSAVLFIGYAGKIGWGYGISSLWIALGNALIGSFLAWKLLARRTRLMTVTLNTVTMPGFLEKKDIRHCLCFDCCHRGIFYGEPQPPFLQRPERGRE